MNRRDVAVRLLRLLRPQAPLMAVSACARVLNQGLGVAIPGIAVALVFGSPQEGEVPRILAYLGLLALAKGFFRYVEQFTGHAVAFRLLARMRVETFRDVVPIAPAGLEDKRSGDLVARVIDDIDKVEPFYAHTIAPLVSAVTVPLLGVVGLAVWVDPVTALVFAPFPVLMFALAPWLRAREVGRLSTQVREESGETTALFADLAQGAREIAVFDAEVTAAGRIGLQSRATAATRRGLARIAAFRSGFVELLAGLAVLAVAIVATIRFEAGLVDLAGLAAGLVVAWVGTAPARAVEGIVGDLEEALAAARRLFDLADQPPAVVPTKGATTEQPSSGSIRYRGVTVSLPGLERPALDEVSLSIDAGSFVGVVGPSGSGKSTLVEMLVRFRDPLGGRVDIGEVDVRDIEDDDLREVVTLVPQRPDIFYGTIGDNLRLARHDAIDTELWEALERAELGDFLRDLHRGLESTVGELGETLSGGQRQRLALARAFLRDPLVVVVDEATSELDRETEQKVLGELVGERGRRTIVMVAHRLETVATADQIFVLDEGSLVEQGSHEELLAGNGVYAGLWQRHLDVIAVP